MLITCPECRYEEDTHPKKLTFRSATATCPQCGHRFRVSVPPGHEDQAPATGEKPAAESPSTGSPPTVKTAPPIEEVLKKEKAHEPGPAEPGQAATHETPAAASAGPPPTGPPPAGPGGSKVATLAPSKAEPEKPEQRVSFHGSGLSLLRIFVVNNLFTVLTLGIYHFWGKAKIRRYLYSSTEFMGERFTFTGTGRELFVGWTKAVILLMVIFSGPNALSNFVHPAFSITTMPIMLFLFPAVMVGARRYKLSRTYWHGTSFAFTGRIGEYIKLYIKGTILTVITFGIYTPYFHVQKERFWRTNTNYGSASLEYTGEASGITRDFLKACLLTIPTLGFCWFWYMAKVARYDWEHTTCEGARFSFDATGRQFLTFLVGNFLLMAFTAGLGYPWVVVRSLRFYSTHLSMTGDIDFGNIAHAPQSSKAVGEGLAGILDIDMAM